MPSLQPAAQMRNAQAQPTHDDTATTYSTRPKTNQCAESRQLGTDFSERSPIKQLRSDLLASRPHQANAAAVH